MIKKVYIAGPITGVENYKEKFAEAEKQLIADGLIVLNPAALPKGLGDCSDYMKICLPMIDVCDAVYMLDGWENSLGACREWGYAKAKGKIIMDEDAQAVR